jgi:hypothetical protein
LLPGRQRVCDKIRRSLLVGKESLSSLCLCRMRNYEQASYACWAHPLPDVERESFLDDATLPNILMQVALANGRPPEILNPALKGYSTPTGPQEESKPTMDRKIDGVEQKILMACLKNLSRPARNNALSRHTYRAESTTTQTMISLALTQRLTLPSPFVNGFRQEKRPIAFSARI